MTTIRSFILGAGLSLVLALSATACDSEETNIAPEIHESDASQSDVPTSDGGMNDGGISDGSIEEEPTPTQEDLLFCQENAKECGTFTSTSGRSVNCGKCDVGFACQNDGTCVECTPLTCSEISGDLCGDIPDGCDGYISCDCTGYGTSCQNGTCLPCPDKSCSDFGIQCGIYDEGCNRPPLLCDECTNPDEACINNVCTDCIPNSVEEICSGANAQCGMVDDGCGGEVNCGFCDAPDECGSDNKCFCVPITCQMQGITCGEAYDGCGNFIACGAPCGEEDNTTTVRLLAGNLTSGNHQSYDNGHGLRIFRGLAPQIAMVQEFKYGTNTKANLRDMVLQGFGPRYYHVVQPKSATNVIPNGIVSYYPIKQWGIFEDEYVGGTRNHVWARIDIPGDRDLWVISVHMHTKASNQLSSINDLLDDLKTLYIPPGDFLAIGGDFNTSKHADNTLKKLASTGLVAIDTPDNNDFPIDQSGNGSTNANRSKPLDGIYTSQSLKDLRTTVVLGKAKNLTDRGLVFDSRVFTPLSAVPPILSSDSKSSNMQHMAVVKDFAIPH